MKYVVRTRIFPDKLLVAKFEALTVVLLSIQFFWDVTLCNFLRFEKIVFPSTGQEPLAL